MKKSFIKNVVAAALSLTLAFSLAGCGETKEASAGSSSKTEEPATEAPAAEEPATETTLKVGANITPHSEILEQAKPILAEKGINLEIVQLEDSVTPNTGVIEGSLDANYFQHVPYLDQFNEENGSDLVSVGAIHYEPFGIYAGKTTDLSALPDGAVVAVPNNVTNEARALLLLAQEGILKLKDDAGIEATVEDIVENPKNIEFKELAPEQLVNALPDVDVAVINGNYAIEGGLSVKDALAVEANDGLAAQTYGNIIATSPDKKDDQAIKTLVEVLQSKEISDFINGKYDGAVVPLQ
ncbi:MAG: MetQ/NlpA family ABC transporter substrate-binding protein [Eubacterium sp.]|nr:MetQ/NlpA family ABC transporter substrate-binding protein [Eubacterium sp.]MBQ7200788.1 MetQ/NlpA family ABC transporter substrate-binding protein [Eubacterium sp.]MBR0118504.1 MetQ/NlpA family ABC transporter substrate-binding protein [Eubacterium sp.]